uniref:C2H2-type domain-containing protein n=1 Tax=Astatotilapia calliptera TaxID=8154 RepID=A0A3P8NK89_ASTCA
MQRTVHAPLQFYEKLARVMNSDQERPFVCNAPGCSQRFPTEDHLMIHRHKHEMTLKFPSIKNDNMLSDQTPTPTRFLKNCEEVGLFSDLDCSIEQEFCKAQEEEDSKQARPRLAVLTTAPTKQTEAASASLHAWNSARPDHARLLCCVDAYGETNVHGLQYDGHAKPRPQQLLLLHSHSLHALRGQTEAKGCTFTPPRCHRKRQHELHGPHDGDDVITAGPRRSPSHALALAPAPAPASPSARIPAPRTPPPQPGPRSGWTPSPAGTQSPSQLPQPPSSSWAPTSDITAPSDALCFTDAAHADVAVSATQWWTAQTSSGRGPG